MKRILTLLLLLISGYGTLMAQRGMGSFGKANSDKYFVYGGYGVGTARWYSELNQTSLYDKFGAKLETGDFNFRARNPTSYYDIGVLFPAGSVRAGIGMSFEEFYLGQISLQPTAIRANETTVIFDESFRFDKLYAQVEVPFWPEARSRFSLSTNVHVGYFSFSGVQRINFFGADNASASYFFGLSPVADVALFPNFYLFLQPMTEFKLFKSQAIDPAGTVRHNIFSYSLMIGIRYDPDTD